MKPTPSLFRNIKTTLSASPYPHSLVCFDFLNCRSCAPFFKGFWKRSLFAGLCNMALFQRLVNVCANYTFFKGVFPIGFHNFPFPRFASQSFSHASLFQRFVAVSQLRPPEQVPWDGKVSFKPSNLCWASPYCLKSPLIGRNFLQSKMLERVNNFGSKAQEREACCKAVTSPSSWSKLILHAYHVL